MSMHEHVYSVLIASASETFTASVQTLLSEAKFSPIRIETSVSAAKRTLLERSFDFVIVNSPLSDDPGTHFAVDTCEARGVVVLLMVRSELYAATYDKVAEHGVYLLPRPTSKQVVEQALDWMMATRERLKGLERKNISIEDKMQEIRAVNRAKWLLIDHISMSEPEAHRYIEKQAMDRCVSRREIAEDIIKTYT